VSADDWWRGLARLAIEVAMTAPAKRGKYSGEAKIPWRVIDEIRAECDRQGIEWRHPEALVEVDR
jgi:hypothetical protein